MSMPPAISTSSETHPIPEINGSSHSSKKGELRRIALIVEDRRLQRPLDLGENPGRDRGGKMAEKQGLHMLPSPTHDESAIVGASTSRGKGLGSRTPQI